MWTLRPQPLPTTVLPAPYEVDSVSFSPDAAALAVVSEVPDPSTHGSFLIPQVAVWPTTGTAAPRVLPGIPFLLPLLPVFAPDGKTLAIGDKLWSLTASAPPRTLRANGQPVLVAFWPRENTFVVWTRQGLALWSPGAGAPPRPIYRFDGGEGPLRTIALSEDGQSLAYWSEPGGHQDSYGPGPLRVRGLAGTKPMRVLDEHALVSSLAFSPALKEDFPALMLAAGAHGDTVTIWPLDAWMRWEPHVLGQRLTAGVRSVAFSPEGKAFAAAFDDETVRLWSLRSTAPERVFQWADHRIESVAFSPDGNTLAWASTASLGEAALPAVQFVSVRSAGSPYTVYGREKAFHPTVAASLRFRRRGFVSVQPTPAALS